MLLLTPLHVAAGILTLNTHAAAHNIRNHDIAPLKLWCWCTDWETRTEQMLELFVSSSVGQTLCGE